MHATQELAYIVSRWVLGHSILFMLRVLTSRSCGATSGLEPVVMCLMLRVDIQRHVRVFCDACYNAGVNAALC